MGTTSSIQSTNTLLNDNILVLNSGPSGSKDSGILIQRYQIDNDTSVGDVVNDTAFITDVLPSQSGISTTQIKLSTNTSSTDNYYTGWWIKITSGFSNNQVRKITGYIGATRIATIDAIWTTQNPAIGDNISLYNKPYVGIVFSEVDNYFKFGSTVQDPGSSSVIFTDTSSIYFNNAISVSTQNSINSSTGSMTLIGGLSINCSINATSVTAGNGLTVRGGASFEQSVFIGNSLSVNNVNITPNLYDVVSSTTFNASNNVTNSNFILINSNVWGFDLYISIKLIATNNLYSNYLIRGVNKNTSWEQISTYAGDSIIDFSITNSGQIQYTCQNYTGFSSLTFKYRMITN